MTQIIRDENTLYTSAGDFPLDEYKLKLDNREWKIRHVSAAISRNQENHFLTELREKLPYGVSLWASSITLAHEAAARGADFNKTLVLELGAGTGLPGIVAASFGARVVQTDRNELVLSLAKRNLEHNKIVTVEQRLVDWTDWQDDTKYDYILGSDILYGEELQHYLRSIFEKNLAPGGRILIADPFREVSLNFLEVLEKDGWSIHINKWNIGEANEVRSVGIFELSRP